MYAAIDIANWFIYKNEQKVQNYGSEKITLLKVLKLLYYAEGCSLALNNKSLFSEKILAWEHGPAVKEVYLAFEDPYNLQLSDEDIENLKNISIEDNNLLEQVFDVFGQYTAWALRDKTHNETPWLEATDNGTHLKGEISRETIKKYFKENYVEE